MGRSSEISCYIQNRIYIRPILEKTAYELFKGIRPNISYFHQFGCTCYILNTKLYLKKFDAKAQRGIFLGYSERLMANRVYNLETLCVEESIHVKFDDKEPGNETPEQDESFADTQILQNLIRLMHLKLVQKLLPLQKLKRKLLLM